VAANAARFTGERVADLGDYHIMCPAAAAWQGPKDPVQKSYGHPPDCRPNARASARYKRLPEDSGQERPRFTTVRSRWTHVPASGMTAQTVVILEEHYCE
jgi:hypothetical protein